MILLRTTETMRKVERIRCGYADPAEEQLRRPLSEHLEDCAQLLEAKGNTPSHIRKSQARVNALLQGCRVRVLQ